jgi:hypothetical protein
LSYVISVSYLVFYLGVSLGVGIALHQSFRGRERCDMRSKYPKYQTLFELLRPTKSAQVFIILFLIRRALFTGVLLFINNSVF